MLFTVPPVRQTKGRSLSAGTELGAAATAVSSLYWQSPELLNNTDLLGEYRHCVFFPATDPLPSISPLSALCVPPVRVAVS